MKVSEIASEMWCFEVIDAKDPVSAVKSGKLKNKLNHDVVQDLFTDTIPSEKPDSSLRNSLMHPIELSDL